MTKFEHLDKNGQQEQEERFFKIVNSMSDINFIYTPDIMLLYDGYACQPDGLNADLSCALEIKSLTQKNYQLLVSSNTLPHRFKRVLYKYFRANPYLELLDFFFINREKETEYQFIEYQRPSVYNFEIKRAHDDESKIKGNYRVVNLMKLSREEAASVILENN